jgi:prophage regulatory protein
MLLEPQMILRCPQVQAKTGLSHASLYRLIAKGAFPKPIKLGERASGWVEAEIDAWLAARVAARDVA